jgi:DNA-binding response OmpR family regulator
MTRLHPKIAISADQEDFLQLYEAIFATHNYDHISIAPNRLPLSTILDVKPDLLMMELVDASSENLQFYKELAMATQSLAIPFLLATNRSAIAETAEFSGMKRLMKKPFGIEEVLAAVKDTLAASPWTE